MDNNFNLHYKFLSLITKKAPYKVAFGGRGGGKSWAIAFCLLYIGMMAKKRILCLREFQTSLKESVHQLLSDLIIQYDEFKNFYNIGRDLIVGKNGTNFTFSGIKNAKNIKSFEGADIAWIEEANYVSKESMMILIPTIRKDGSEIWFSFNPSSIDDPVYDYILHPRPNQITINVNYLDNPFCSKRIKDEAEFLKNSDYELYQHVYLGHLRAFASNLIYKDKFKVEDIKQFLIRTYDSRALFKNEPVKVRYGLDFGWVHPSAIVETFETDGTIYITREIVASEMDIDDIEERYTSEMLFQDLSLVYGDPARIDLINQLATPRFSKHGNRLKGIRIEPAHKGQGSVESGITWLKTHKNIIIDSSCIYTIDNFKKYSYKMDVNGIILPVIQKINDDCPDAVRYAYSDVIEEVSNRNNIWNDHEFLYNMLTNPQN